MIGCNQVKRLIDESDNPALLAYEAASHVDACEPCKQFAHERARIRELLASAERVSAPLNFDAVLRARIAERTASRVPAWLSPSFYMKFGAATAVLLVAIMAAQSGGFFGEPQPESPATTQLAAAKQPQPQGDDKASLAVTEQGLSKAGVAESPRRIRTVEASFTRASSRPARISTRDLTAESASQMGAQDGAVMLVRGKDGEREVPMPTVSVGAQSLLYQNAGRPVVSNVRASF